MSAYDTINTTFSPTLRWIPGDLSGTEGNLTWNSSVGTGSVSSQGTGTILETLTVAGKNTYASLPTDNTDSTRYLRFDLGQNYTGSTGFTASFVVQDLNGLSPTVTDTERFITLLSSNTGETDESSSSQILAQIQSNGDFSSVISGTNYNWTANDMPPYLNISNSNIRNGYQYVYTFVYDDSLKRLDVWVSWTVDVLVAQFNSIDLNAKEFRYIQLGARYPDSQNPPYSTIMRIPEFFWWNSTLSSFQVGQLADAILTEYFTRNPGPSSSGDFTPANPYIELQMTSTSFPEYRHNILSEANIMSNITLYGYNIVGTPTVTQITPSLPYTMSVVEVTPNSNYKLVIDEGTNNNFSNIGEYTITVEFVTDYPNTIIQNIIVNIFDGLIYTSNINVKNLGFIPRPDEYQELILDSSSNSNYSSEVNNSLITFKLTGETSGEIISIPAGVEFEKIRALSHILMYLVYLKIPANSLAEDTYTIEDIIIDFAGGKISTIPSSLFKLTFYYANYATIPPTFNPEVNFLNDYEIVDSSGKFESLTIIDLTKDYIRDKLVNKNYIIGDGTLQEFRSINIFTSVVPSGQLQDVTSLSQIQFKSLHLLNNVSQDKNYEDFTLLNVQSSNFYLRFVITFNGDGTNTWDVNFHVLIKVFSNVANASVIDGDIISRVTSTTTTFNVRNFFENAELTVGYVPGYYRISYENLVNVIKNYRLDLKKYILGSDTYVNMSQGNKNNVNKVLDKVINTVINSFQYYLIFTLDTSSPLSPDLSTGNSFSVSLPNGVDFVLRV